MKELLKILSLAGLLYFANPNEKACTQDQDIHHVRIAQRDSLIQKIETLEDNLAVNKKDNNLKKELSHLYAKLQQGFTRFLDLSEDEMADKQDIIKGEEYLTRAIELDPKNLFALNHRGEMYVQLGGRVLYDTFKTNKNFSAEDSTKARNDAQRYFELALEDNYKAVKTEPNNPEAYRHLAQTYRDISETFSNRLDLVESLNCYEKIRDLLDSTDEDSLKFYPNECEISFENYYYANYYSIVDLNFSLGRYKEVIRECEGIPTEYKPLTLYPLINSLINIGREDQAKKEYNKLKGNPFIEKNFEDYKN